MFQQTLNPITPGFSIFPYLDTHCSCTPKFYVDLNPVRAAIAQTPEESDFTSIQERILFASKQLEKKRIQNQKTYIKEYDSLEQPKFLMPFLSMIDREKDTPKISLTLSEYLEVVDYTGRDQRDDKRGFVSAKAPDIFSRITLKPKALSYFISHFGSFSYAIGHSKGLKTFGNFVRKRALKGSAFAKKCFG